MNQMNAALLASIKLENASGAASAVKSKTIGKKFDDPVINVQLHDVFGKHKVAFKSLCGQCPDTLTHVRDATIDKEGTIHPAQYRNDFDQIVLDSTARIGFNLSPLKEENVLTGGFEFGKTTVDSPYVHKAFEGVPHHLVALLHITAPKTQVRAHADGNKSSCEKRLKISEDPSVVVDVNCSVVHNVCVYCAVRRGIAGESASVSICVDFKQFCEANGVSRKYVEAQICRGFGTWEITVQDGHGRSNTVLVCGLVGAFEITGLSDWRGACGLATAWSSANESKAGEKAKSHLPKGVITTGTVGQLWNYLLSGISQREQKENQVAVTDHTLQQQIVDLNAAYNEIQAELIKQQVNSAQVKTEKAETEAKLASAMGKLHTMHSAYMKLKADHTTAGARIRAVESVIRSAGTAEQVLSYVRKAWEGNASNVIGRASASTPPPLERPDLKSAAAAAAAPAMKPASAANLAAAASRATASAVASAAKHTTPAPSIYHAAPGGAAQPKAAVEVMTDGDNEDDDGSAEQ